MQPSGFKLQLGEQAPYFSLQGTDGKIYSLADFRNERGLVVLFTCNHCPYAQAYEERIKALAEKYQPEGVQFVAICSNDAVGYPEDSFDNMVKKWKLTGWPFPYLQDETQSVAKAYDAACTPEAYVFDAEQHLAYHGCIDDNHADTNGVSKHYLRDAIEAVLAGNPPKQPLTEAIGCSIKWR